MKNGIKTVRIMDSHIYSTSKNWTFGLGDDESRQFGIMFEVIDMDEATGEPEFKDYPFVVSASIVADKPHESFNEGMDEGYKPTKSDLLYNTMSYMGGVPVDHTLSDAIKNSDESEHLNAFDSLSSKFSVNEATVRGETPKYGTVAAQRGPLVEHRYLQFKTQDAAEKYVKLLLDRAGCLGMMIGFILDRPVNMVGETGWDVISKHVHGANSKRTA